MWISPSVVGTGQMDSVEFGTVTGKDKRCPVFLFTGLLSDTILCSFSLIQWNEFTVFGIISSPPHENQLSVGDNPQMVLIQFPSQFPPTYDHPTPQSDDIRKMYGLVVCHYVHQARGRGF